MPSRCLSSASGCRWARLGPRALAALTGLSAADPAPVGLSTPEQQDRELAPHREPSWFIGCKVFSAFEEFYRVQFLPLVQFVMGAGVRVPDAEDIVQDAMAETY